MSHQYDNRFMDYADRSSEYSARVITSRILSKLPILSVLDVGCAAGTWLRIWSSIGVNDCHGVDGSYVNRASLRVPQDWFTPVDLSQPLHLGRTFDLVQSLEVGEHIPASAAEVFVESIVRHAGRYLLFSAAPPGQGGEFHINEQPFEFWRAYFERCGFVPFDWIRPIIASDAQISFWYRYNVFLYVRRDFVDSLPDDVRATEVRSGSALKDISPPSFKLRKAVIRRLPQPFQDQLARLKARLLPTGRF
jgi:hypothetical protein